MVKVFILLQQVHQQPLLIYIKYCQKLYVTLLDIQLKWIKCIISYLKKLIT